LHNTARTFGEALHANPFVQTYLQAQANCAVNLEAAELENRLLVLYQELIGRQQRGEELQRSEIDTFNALKKQVYQHPLIDARQAALTPVKRVFAEIANEINFSLGMEFPSLALE
jgi:cell fate (sporulation/competence/biofilm development) regulator YlbF (YheA/YmcA/DUF963 family)